MHRRIQRRDPGTFRVNLPVCNKIIRDTISYKDTVGRITAKNPTSIFIFLLYNHIVKLHAETLPQPMYDMILRTYPTNL